MKITGLRIAHHNQFRDTRIDLRDADGQPLRKVCFIGPNGTGKTTILRLLQGFLNHGGNSGRSLPGISSFVEFTCEDGDFVVVPRLHALPATVKERPEWAQFLEPEPVLHQQLPNDVVSLQAHSLQPLRQSDNNLVIFASNEGAPFRDNLPQSSLNNASAYFKKSIPLSHVVTSETLHEFWTFLIYLVARRKEDWLAALETPEYAQLSVVEARARFDEHNPEILTELAWQWNLILEPAGLFFDTANAKVPVQLSDNLSAFVFSKVTKRHVPYGALSSGIKKLLFRLGHIYALYFNRTIDSGFLLFDEPELSLFPDILNGLIDRYVEVTSESTQIFVATHSPVIAAQFRPEERVILRIDDHGYVTATRGVAPEGDDPNDLLTQDFQVRNLLGRAGRVAWERCRQLRDQVLAETDPETKLQLLAELDDIVGRYNFSLDTP